MHAHQLAEVGARLALQGLMVIQYEPPLSDTALAEYWSACRQRQSEWNRAWVEFRQQAAANTTAAPLAWLRFRPVVAEAILSELLARVWAAISSGQDHVTRRQLNEPIMHNVLMAHIDWRRRVIQSLISEHALPPGESTEINQLQQRVERWTDLLLGYVDAHVPARSWGFDPQRVADFAIDLIDEGELFPNQLSASVLLRSMRAALRDAEAIVPFTASSNDRIAGAIAVACEPAGCRWPGLSPRLWQLRLDHRAEDCGRLVDELLAIS